MIRTANTFFGDLEEYVNRNLASYWAGYNMRELRPSYRHEPVINYQIAARGAFNNLRLSSVERALVDALQDALAFRIIDDDENNVSCNQLMAFVEQFVAAHKRTKEFHIPELCEKARARLWLDIFYHSMHSEDITSGYYTMHQAYRSLCNIARDNSGVKIDLERLGGYLQSKREWIARRAAKDFFRREEISYLATFFSILVTMDNEEELVDYISYFLKETNFSKRFILEAVGQSSINISDIVFDKIGVEMYNFCKEIITERVPSAVNLWDRVDNSLSKLYQQD